MEFADRAMDNWRLLGSDPNEAKGLVQVAPFHRLRLILGALPCNHKNISVTTCNETPHTRSGR
jgi:hypothetical protein